MINRNLTPAVKTIVLSAGVAAGTDGALVGATEIDTKGYTGCRIILVIGTVAAGGLINTRLKNSDTSGSYGSGTVDSVGSDLASSADIDAGKAIVHEVHKPKRRYLRLFYQRTVANVSIASIIVELFGQTAQPVTQDSTIKANQVLNDPEPSSS